MESRNTIKLLYILPIDWEWIWQRPQILAMELMKVYDLTILYPKVLLKRWKSQNTNTVVPVKKYYLFPFADSIWFSKIFKYLTYQMAVYDISKYEMIWISYPTQMQQSFNKYQGFIIYDCMDNYVAMIDDSKKIGKLQLYEQQLVNRANIILVSSEYLMRYLSDKYGAKNIVVIRNAVDINIISKPKLFTIKSQYDLAYIGTIAEWMDFELLNKTQNNQIHYHMIGPKIISEVDLGNIEFHGVVEHNKLNKYIEDMDCLIMPFILNDIVRAVDPVKLYEYISFGKCIISIYYEELERFDKYVYFYKDEREYIKLLDELTRVGFPAKYNSREQQEFLANNTWEKRVENIVDSVESRRNK